jgi:hypothetical protein
VKLTGAPAGDAASAVIFAGICSNGGSTSTHVTSTCAESSPASATWLSLRSRYAVIVDVYGRNGNKPANKSPTQYPGRVIKHESFPLNGSLEILTRANRVNGFGSTMPSPSVSGHGDATMTPFTMLEASTERSSGLAV